MRKKQDLDKKPLALDLVKVRELSTVTGGRGPFVPSVTC
jgi:hypothetical protein